MHADLTRKQNLQANSRSACQFWHKREKVVCNEIEYTGTLFLPKGLRLSLFSLYGQPFPRYRPIFKTALFWAWNVAIERSSRSCTYNLFLPNGSKFSLFSLYGQRFPRYWPVFKIALFGHETWPLTKVPEVAHTFSFYPMGRNWAYFCSMSSGFRYIGSFWFNKLHVG